MNCSICSHPNHPEIVAEYTRSGSYRRTAPRFGVGYRSLQRHITYCVYAVMEEAEQDDFERAVREVRDAALKLFGEN
jgi:hypothetical protein